LRGGAGGLEREVLVSALWVAIVAVTLASAAIKAAGPILVGGRELPPRVSAIIALLAPALLAALVVTETFGDDSHLVLDERALGVGVAAVALALRAPVLLAVALAALVTALARLFA
jgi:branched chain amino acid efflux pump